MGVIIQMKTAFALCWVLVIYGAADVRAFPETITIDVKDESDRSYVPEIVIDSSNVNKSLSPAFSSIAYTIGCGIQVSDAPFKKITADSDSENAGKIVGGYEANAGEFPWQISLQQSSRRGKTHICGGSVVSEDVIITAGHCVSGTSPSQLQIVAGAHHLFNTTGKEQVRKVRKILKNGKGYDQSTLNNDIALLVLDKPLKFDPYYIAPVCLPYLDFVYDGITGIITGWGRLSESGKLSPTLQVVSVPLISPKECSKSYESAGYGSNIGKCHICSGSDEGGVDSCQGDSGGPMTCVESDGRHYLCGIVSWGIGCGRPNHPGVYTFTPCYSDWIAEQVKTYNSTSV